MKILLTSLNAKFIHTSLALYCLKAYSHEYTENVKIKELTINNDLDYCLSELMVEKPYAIGFSTYIWNIEETIKLIGNIKKVAPEIKIILGGPEVSYNPKKYLVYADFIVTGEGEKPFYELLKHFDNKQKLENIEGIVFEKDGEQIENICINNLELADIPFPYTEIDSFKNKIIYYESSRGCPYSCSYCLSSSTNGVRFLSEERVKSDLSFFLEQKPKQVKFVDRTFNAKKEHAIMIWQYLIDNDNGVTNFHFELSGNTITDDMIEVLKPAREGLIQFEIGIQSTNEKTISEIDRAIDNEKVFNTVRKILALKNIHVHVDLIAGLPYENFDSFRNSFNDVYSLKADMVQLGFLKLLHGSKLRLEADKYGIKYRDYAPYEVLSTNDISYLELETLKGIEHLSEMYYNSHKYENTLNYAETLFDSPFDMYLALHNYVSSNTDMLVSVSKSYFRTLFYEVTKDDFVKELLRFDLYKEENISNLPEMLLNEKIIITRESTEKIYTNEEIFKNHINNNITKKQYIRNSRIERFTYDIIEYIKNKNIVKKDTFILFDYYGILKPIKLNLEDINYDTERES